MTIRKKISKPLGVLIFFFRRPQYHQKAPLIGKIPPKEAEGDPHSAAEKTQQGNKKIKEPNSLLWQVP